MTTPILDRNGHCVECPPCLGSHVGHCPRCDAGDPAAKVAERAKLLANGARDGAYAIWLSVSERRTSTRLGARRLAGLYPPAVLANITVNVGGPVDVRIRQRTGAPCLYVRGRFGGDFREALLAVSNVAKAAGCYASVRDATGEAFMVVQKGIER